MKAFIQVHGVYVGFWLLMWAVSMGSLYVVVRLAIEHALRNGRM